MFSYPCNAGRLTPLAYTLHMNTLLLIAHGSRRPEANADLEYVAADMRRRNLFAFVQCSFLELAEPNIHTGGVKCVEAGATSVVESPLNKIIDCGAMSARVRRADPLDRGSASVTSRCRSSSLP